MNTSGMVSFRNKNPRISVTSGEFNPIYLSNQNLVLKQIVWIYFFLLIFEGALRKWFLPGLATPLLIVRDPFVIFLVVMAWYKGLIKPSFLIIGMVFTGIAAIYSAFFLGHHSLKVALFGARILIFYFPLMFVIGKVFNKQDVIKMGRVTIWIAIPMAVLVALQFYSPQSAWVNKGVGGSEDGIGFSGAMGYFRPPGTFSFTTGNTQFYSLVAVYVLYFWLFPKGVSKIALIGATIGLFAVIPLSISRALFFQVLVSIIFALIAVSRNPKFLGKMLVAVIGAFIVLLALSQTSFFQTASEAFISRFDTANDSEGGLNGVLIDRYLGGMIAALYQTSELPFFGYGIGMGTNAGSMLLTGEVLYLISEGEWGRLIGEMGLIMGLLVIIIRLAFCAVITLKSFRKVGNNDLLAFMLLSFALLIIPQGQWAQPTTLGFSSLIGGLVLATLNSTHRA